MTRRGVGLIIALAVVTLVGVTASLLALQVGAMVRQRRHEQSRTNAQILLDSGIAYVVAHRQQLAQDQPSDAIILPVEQSLPSSTQADLTLKHLEDNTGIRIQACFGSGQFRACEEQKLSLGSGNQKM